MWDLKEEGPRWMALSVLPVGLQCLGEIPLKPIVWKQGFCSYLDSFPPIWKSHSLAIITYSELFPQQLKEFGSRWMLKRRRSLFMQIFTMESKRKQWTRAIASPLEPKASLAPVLGLDGEHSLILASFMSDLHKKIPTLIQPETKSLGEWEPQALLCVCYSCLLLPWKMPRAGIKSESTNSLKEHNKKAIDV